MSHGDPEYTLSKPSAGGSFGVLGVPLLRENDADRRPRPVRADVRPFTEKQIELVTTFADQAVIAIENVRLFDRCRSAPGICRMSLDDLRTAQDRLVQTEKLASLGQLTAGIAHEIKNPLNFVNNFSALSAELIDELNDVLKPAALDDKTREEIDELTLMLKGNLEKVVQHGKRADSSSRTCCCIRARDRANTGPPISTRSSRRASTSPITARGPKNPASTSRCSATSIRRPA